MRKLYAAPQLVEYGLLEQITLGQAGSLPDFNISFSLINIACPTQTFLVGTKVQSRVACINNFS